MRILAVEDDQLQLDLLTAVLASAGYSDITTATSGMSALNKIASAQAPFDCIMLDIQMPGYSGIELCAVIRSMNEYKTTPVIMITAMSDKAFVDEAFFSGATDYVTKPFDNLELVSRIQIAAKLRTAHQIAADKTFALKNLQIQVELARQFDFDEAVVIEDVPGVIDHLLLENYLLQLSRNGAFMTAAVAFKIDEFRELYDRSSATDLFDTLTDIAEAISEHLVGSQYLMAYMGRGVFVSIVDRANSKISSGLLQEIQATIDAIDFTYADGLAYRVTLLMGEVCRNGMLSMGGISQLVGDAILNVERIVRGNGHGVANSNDSSMLRKTAARFPMLSKFLS